MATKKSYKVIAWCTYGDRESKYVVGAFRTKREAKACLALQYDTPSRSHYISEEKVIN